MEALIRQLKEIARVEENVPMGPLCSFRTGGKARWLLQAEGEEELAAALPLLTSSGVDFYLLGNGSNTLVRDGGYPGVVLRLGERFSFCEREGRTLRAGAGMLLSSLAKEAAKAELTGLEFASGIPGSLGGAVFMNAGAYEGEMKQVLTKVRLMDPADGRIYEEAAEALDLSYRHSRLCESGEVVLAAELELAEGRREEIDARMKDLAERRNSKQPLRYASAGSFFKRPPGHYAGALIQEAGCKGLAVGDAEISTQHAGFLINKGEASATEILELMHLVQARVKEQSGVDLEPEVRIIGEEV